jgi:hypothetical protein
VTAKLIALLLPMINIAIRFAAPLPCWQFNVHGHIPTLFHHMDLVSQVLDYHGSPERTTACLLTLIPYDDMLQCRSRTNLVNWREKACSARNTSPAKYLQKVKILSAQQLQASTPPVSAPCAARRHPSRARLIIANRATTATIKTE